MVLQIMADIMTGAMSDSVISNGAEVMPPKTVIIGCGNTNRLDDGVGPHVINKLKNMSLPNDIALFDAGTDGMGILYQARGVEQLIIIDARIPEGSPGAIYEVPGDILQRPPNQSMNLHDFRWDHALYAGHKIYGEDFPENVSVYLIEAKSIDLGLGLSSEVEGAANAVAQKIANQLSPKNETSEMKHAK